MGLTPLPNQRHETSLSQYEGPDEKNWLREVGTGCIPNLMQALSNPQGLDSSFARALLRDT